MSNIHSTKNVCVIVLGDIGRSPRMQYHVQSLIEHNFNVDLIGYVETVPLICGEQQQQQLKIHQLTPLPNLNLPNGILQYIFKIIWQTLCLSIALFNVRKSNFIFCQNPPAIPTLLICYLYALITRCKFIIDWHNYAYTLMAISASKDAKNISGTSTVVGIAKWLEKMFGRKSTYNLCVTKAMQCDLLERWNINATVLYDRPMGMFQSTTVEQKHNLFKQLAKTYSNFQSSTLAADNDEMIIEATAFTEKLVTGKCRLKATRPAILFSSTSWTMDEDFSILLAALDVYEQNAQQQQYSNKCLWPNLLCIITGKGPQKDHYLQLIKLKQWQKITLITPWLDADIYPKLIAAADLGVCLHWSSSGLDLPMKIVDMFGCGLPVCAINFKCLSELVQHGENGFIFDNHTQLAEQLINWFEDFPNNVTLVNVKKIFQQNLRNFQSLRWHDNWNENVLPLFS